MRGQLRAELLKQGTTKTTVGLGAAMLGLALLVVLLHAFSLSSSDLATRSGQLRVLVEGAVVPGTLFAGLLGALSITGEIRHGTIRPTLLVSPWRSRVLVAKSLVAGLTGAALGLAATAVAAGAGTAAIAARGPQVELGAGDFALLVVGGAAAAALWAVLGLGLGAVVRNQVATVVGLAVWLLFIENVLVDSLPGVSRYLPGALGRAITGHSSGTLGSPALGAVLLAFYAAAALAVGWIGTTRRDFA